jgi:hypothetical protein
VCEAVPYLWSATFWLVNQHGIAGTPNIQVNPKTLESPSLRLIRNTPCTSFSNRYFLRQDTSANPDCGAGDEDVPSPSGVSVGKNSLAEDRACKSSAVIVSGSEMVDQNSLLNGTRRSKNSASKDDLSLDADRRNFMYDFNARSASFARQSGNCLLFDQMRDE